MNEVNNHDALIKQIDELMEYATEVSGTLVSIMKDCRAELLRKYVPMTDDERNEMMARWYENHDLPSISQYIESEVIRRAGLEVQE